MEFTDINTIPKSGYYVPPKYATGAAKFWLKLLGYDAAGQRNNWGKALMVVGPTNGTLANIAAQKVAGNNNADDSQDNINSALAGNVGMLKAQIGVGKAILGGYTGNYGMIADGAGDFMGGTTTAATSKPQSTDNGKSFYKKYKHGNKVMKVLSPSAYIKGKVVSKNNAPIKIYNDNDDTEDITMHDKTTGKKVGEMRYGERIFDQKANEKLEQLRADAKRTGNYTTLGKYVAREMATHDDIEDKEVKTPKTLEDGGMMGNDGFTSGDEDGYYDENGNFIPKKKKKSILESLNPIFDSLMSGLTSYGMGGGKSKSSGGSMGSNSLSNMNKSKASIRMRGGGKLLSPAVLVRKYKNGNKVIKPPTAEIISIIHKGYEGLNGRINTSKLSYDEKQKLQQWFTDNKENVNSGSFIRSILRSYNSDGSTKKTEPNKLEKAWKKFDSFLENNGKEKVGNANASPKTTTTNNNNIKQGTANSYGANTFSGEVYNPSKSKNTGTPNNYKTNTILSPAQLLRNSYKASQGIKNTSAISDIHFMNSDYRNRFAAFGDKNKYQDYSDFVNGLSATDLKSVVKGTKYENYTPEKLRQLASDKKIGEVHSGFIEFYNKIRGDGGSDNTNTNPLTVTKANGYFETTGGRFGNKDVNNNSLSNQDKTNIAKRTTTNTTTFTNEDKQNIFLSSSTDKSLPSNKTDKSTINDKLSKVSDYMDYAVNGSKFLLGAMGAKKPLPTWEIPESWKQYVRDSELQSKKGFTTTEKDILQNSLDRNRSASVEAIRQTIGGGGSSGAVLAALDGTNRNTALAENDLALKDASLQRQNFAQYGNVLGKDVSLDRQLFEDEYTKAAANKNASAQLMASGMQGIIDQSQYNKSYGTGSAYDQLQKAILEEQHLTNAALKQKINVSSDDVAFRENTQKAIDGLSNEQKSALSDEYKAHLKTLNYKL